MDTPLDRDPLGRWDPGDDPSSGRIPFHDPDWIEAQQVLAADASFLARRARVDDDLFLTVRPVSSTTSAQAGQAVDRAFVEVAGTDEAR